jgi:hypothetical protein
LQTSNTGSDIVITRPPTIAPTTRTITGLMAQRDVAIGSLPRQPQVRPRAAPTRQ